MRKIEGDRYWDTQGGAFRRSVRRITFPVPSFLENILLPRSKFAQGFLRACVGRRRFLGQDGCGMLTSRAVLRSGAGLVTYALPEAAFEKYDSRFPEIMVEGISDAGRGYFVKILLQ
jgi:hypothetical protein